MLLLGFGGCASIRSGTRPPGGFKGGSDFQSGHLLREPGPAPKAVEEREVKTAILGAGMAGLSAAWQLDRSGWKEFEIFDLETRAGGNSRYASYPASKAPLAAHYLPVPTAESVEVRELLLEMGLMRQTSDGKPDYDERQLCQPLKERLRYGKRWYESLVPLSELSEGEREQFADFKREVKFWQEYRDGQGRKAFAIPLAYSSREPELMALDRISFARYAQEKGWTLPFVRWLLEYATRDDYGAGLEQVSAWAGLHYFCCRDGGGFRDDDAIFVWPEGNGRIVEHLLGRVGDRLRTRHLVKKLEPGKKVAIELLQVDSGRTVRLVADNCIYCLPAFQRPYHFAEAPAPSAKYAPWVTANLVLRRPPQELSDFSEPAWDNVIYGSSSLGYVVARHQTAAFRNSGPNVWTWYRSFPGEEPEKVRERLLKSRWEEWRNEIIDDLKVVHPDIAQVTERIDVALFGHGMIVPSVNYVWGPELESLRRPLENVWFAHSDLSGISVFEEAQYRGVLAAEELMSSG